MKTTTLTDEQTQQIEEIVEHLLVDHPTARHHKACVEALSIIRAARAQDVTSQNHPWVKDEDVESFNAWLSLFVEERIKEAMNETCYTHNADALEAAYWEFDARVKGYGKWKLNRQSERDAFKSAVSGLLDVPIEPVKQEPGFYGRAAARLSQRVKELELEQSGKWRDHVEHRMLTWKTSHMNESGDQLSLKDFMDEYSLHDLIDFVCDEYAAPVRTKDHCNPWQDLTDDEIEAVWIKTINSGTVTVSRSFARAVIAADRKLNGVEK